jgi:serine/threonine protein kinase
VIDENYWIKIIDFGSASYIPAKKENYFTKFNGTAHFASPEVAAGEPYRGPEAEIW